MQANLYIDDIDVYSQYGVSVVSGSVAELLAFPPLKEVDVIDWYEEDGVEADLSAPQLDGREIELSFVAENDYGMQALIAMLTEKVYHDFHFKDIEQDYKLRLLSQSELKVYGNATIFTLKFSDDNPDRRYSSSVWQPNTNIVTGYSLAGRDFGLYSINILSGTLAEVLKCPDVKSNIVRDYKYISGIGYEAKTVKYSSKEVSLKCLMTSSNLTSFWSTYNALLLLLKSSAEKILQVDTSIYVSMSCYYKKCATSYLSLTNGIAWAFTLTFSVTEFYPNEYDVLLISEDGSIITSEDSYAIDLL